MAMAHRGDANNSTLRPAKVIASLIQEHIPMPPSTPTQPPPATIRQPPESLSVGAITDLGADLTRLIVALIPLSVRVVDTVSTTLSNALAAGSKTADGTASTQAASDLGAAATTLIGATARLSLDLLTTATKSLNAITNAVGTEASDSGTPPHR